LEARYADAEVLYRKALDEFQQPGLDRAATLENLGVLLRAQGRYAEARVTLEDARGQLEALSGADSLASAKAVSNLAALYWARGDGSRRGVCAQGTGRGAPGAAGATSGKGRGPEQSRGDLPPERELRGGGEVLPGSHRNLGSGLGRRTSRCGARADEPRFFLP